MRASHSVGFCVAAGLLCWAFRFWVRQGWRGPHRLTASHEQTHLGYPQDWSSRHLLMPGMRAEDVLAAGERDPRYVYNMVMRQVAVENLRRRAPRPRRQNEDRLGGFAGERVRAAEPISGEIPV